MIIGWSAITGIIGWPALVMLFAGPRVGEPGKPVRLPIPWRDVGGYRPTGRSIAACRRGEPRVYTNSPPPSPPKPPPPPAPPALLVR
ncbi:transketolase [Mycobacterium tuberculosis variant africanum K85]|uniref:Transketolase n=1 Tax=Mycobacterium tuberculosis variant africanum K85 TaxID=611304 RepID=A0A9P2M4A3_MYCTX|nr:transketolase [Mycobacterium tuberculosis variant africanum K85]